MCRSVAATAYSMHCVTQRSALQELGYDSSEAGRRPPLVTKRHRHKKALHHLRGPRRERLPSMISRYEPHLTLVIAHSFDLIRLSI